MPSPLFFDIHKSKEHNSVVTQPSPNTNLDIICGISSRLSFKANQGIFPILSATGSVVTENKRGKEIGCINHDYAIMRMSKGLPTLQLPLLPQEVSFKVHN